MKEKKDCMQIADMRKEKRDNIDQVDQDTKLKRQKLQTHKSWKVWLARRNVPFLLKTIYQNSQEKEETIWTGLHPFKGLND